MRSGLAQILSQDPRKLDFYRVESKKKLLESNFYIIFNNFVLLDKKNIAVLVKNYTDLIDDLTKEAQLRFINLSLEPNLATIEKLIAILKEKFSNRVNEFKKSIIYKSCNELLDGHCQLNWEVVEKLCWKSFKEIHVPQNVEKILRSFYVTVFEQIVDELNRAKYALQRPEAFNALTTLMREKSPEGIRAAILQTQQIDFCDNATLKIEHDIALLPADFLGELKNIVHEDLYNYQQHKILKKQKLELWINVMFFCGLIKNRLDILRLIYIELLPFLKQGSPEDQANIYFIGEVDFINDSVKNKLNLCLKQLKAKEMPKNGFFAEEKAAAIKEDPLKETKALLIACDKFIIINLIRTKFLAFDPYYRMHAEECLLAKLQSLILGPDDKSNVVELLQQYAQICKNQKIQTGCLYVVIKDQLEILDARKEQKSGLAFAH